jgi:2-haloacid dehalogenase
MSALRHARVLAFDAYGTLLNFEAVAKSCPSLARHGLDDASRWASLSNDWRSKQLAYTWLSSLSGSKVPGEHHRNFEELTKAALLWSLDKAKVARDEALISELLSAYGSCPAFEDSFEALKAFKGSGKYKLCILSNGTREMLENACKSAKIDGLLDAVISVEDQTSEPKYFKPHPAVYSLVCEKFGVKPSEVALISSNGWDIHGSSTYGFHALWVNRGGVPDDAGLPGGPTVELKSLTELKDLLLG